MRKRMINEWARYGNTRSMFIEEANYLSSGKEASYLQQPSREESNYGIMPKRGRKSNFVNELDRLASSLENSYGANESNDITDAHDGRLGTKSASAPPSKRRTVEFREKGVNLSLEDLVNVLTLPTFIALYQSCRFVPQSYRCRREGIIANILKVTKVPLSESMLYPAMQAINCHEEPLHLGTPPIDILWQATNETGMPHLRFLAHPTVLCY